MRVRLFLLIILSTWVSSETFAQVHPEPQPYDELRDAKGEIRPQYRALYDAYLGMPPELAADFEKVSQDQLDGDNPVYPLPKVLTSAEMDLLMRGVAQRAQAIGMLLLDVMTDKNSMVAAGIIPMGELISVIVREPYAYALFPLLRRMQASQLRFFYGPDIVRLPDGNFAVVEDNIGNLGGFGDMVAIHELLLKLNPAFAKIVAEGKYEDPLHYFRVLAGTWKKDAEKYGGVAVFLAENREAGGDHERNRLSRLLKRFGIPTVQPSQLKVKNGRLMWRKRNGTEVKVGYVHTGTLPEYLDARHPLLYRHELRNFFTSLARYDTWSDYQKKKYREITPEWLRENQAFIKRFNEDKVSVATADRKLKTLFGREDWLMRPSRIPGLLDAIADSKVGFTFGPAVSFPGDKQIYGYMEELIRFYVKEEPILKNIPSQSLTTAEMKDGNYKIELKHDLLNEIETNNDAWVVKGVDGAGGHETFIGKSIREQSDWTKFIGLYREAPFAASDMVAQKYVPFSQMDGMITDLRVYTQVSLVRDRFRFVMSDVPWARFSPAGGSGLVNVSSGGQEGLVLVEKAQKAGGKPVSGCETMLIKKVRKAKVVSK